MAEELNIEEYTKKYIVGFSDYSGIKLTKLDEGFVEGEISVTDHHLNPIHTVHGGAVFTIADTIGGVAARTVGANPTTCSSTISYLRPTVDCRKLIASAKVIKNGANTVVTDIEVKTDKGIHVSQVLATYFNLGNKVPSN